MADASLKKQDFSASTDDGAETLCGFNENVTVLY